MSVNNMYEQNKVFTAYIDSLKSEEVFDKNTEIEIAGEIRSMELKRWFELLCDSENPRIVDDKILFSVEEIYNEDAALAIRDNLVRLRDAQNHEMEKGSFSQDVLEALESTLLLIDKIDKKRKLFFAVYNSLCLGKLSDQILHSDTIWNTDVLDARIAQLKDRFIRANLHVVVTIAKRYDFGMVPLTDLIQEGNMGLIDAVDRFDHTMGFQFSTFASSWIRNSIRKALAKHGNVVRIPARVVNDKFRLQSTIQKFELKHGHTPSENELAKIMKVSLKQLRRIQSRSFVRVQSEENPDHGSSSSRFTSVLADETTTHPGESILLKTWLRKKDQVLDALTSIEKAIICWRFGLDDGNELTLHQIGTKCNLSKERIRQIQNSALKKLRLAFTGM